MSNSQSFIIYLRSSFSSVQLLSRAFLSIIRLNVLSSSLSLSLNPQNQGDEHPSIIKCSLILAEAQDGLDKQEVNGDDDDDDDDDGDGGGEGVDEHIFSLHFDFSVRCANGI